MELAATIGISVSEFWNITPFELKIQLKGYERRKHSEYEEYQIKLKNQQKLMTIQAYQISRWVWAKKLDINKILEEKAESKQMTDDEMLQMVKNLNNLFGGEVVKDGAKK